MTIGWFMNGLTQYSDFHNRARRKEFWWFSLIQWFIVAFLFGMAGVMVAGSGAYDSDSLDMDQVPLSGWIFFYAAIAAIVVLVIPYFAVTVRRLHDTGRSGWWSVFLLFLPIVVWIFALLDGDAQPNKYGTDPKELER